MAASTGIYCAAHSIFSIPEFMILLVGGVLYLHLPGY
jgi:hypothetical protein